MSSAEQVAAGAGVAVALVRRPVHQVLAAAGLVAPADPVRRDVRTIGFLRALDLDPEEILGSAVVERADAWVVPADQARSRWWRPIGSHSWEIAQ
jgi:hypothetical protein